MPEDLRGHIAYKDVPVVLLGRMAVESQLQNQGVGGLVLTDALSRCLEMSNSLGSAGIFVNVKNARAKAFYEKYGFIPFEDDPLSLYLPMATIAKVKKDQIAEPSRNSDRPKKQFSK